jgi:hypothetical protein
MAMAVMCVSNSYIILLKVAFLLRDRETGVFVLAITIANPKDPFGKAMAY